MSLTGKEKQGGRQLTLTSRASNFSVLMLLRNIATLLRSGSMLLCSPHQSFIHRKQNKNQKRASRQQNP